MRAVKDLLKYSDKVEPILKLIVTFVFFAWNVVEGAVFQNEYPRIFVRLYHIPLWRLALLIALIAGGMWCHSVGIMLAFTAFFYVMDMEVTMDKWK
jgi:hypothetical protein